MNDRDIVNGLIALGASTKALERFNLFSAAVNRLLELKREVDTLKQEVKYWRTENEVNKVSTGESSEYL